MQAKLTPGIVLLALLIGALLGPAQTLADGVTRDQLTSLNYWLDILSALVSGGAKEFVALVAVLATSLSLPLYQAARASSAASKPEVVIGGPPPAP